MKRVHLDFGGHPRPDMVGYERGAKAFDEGIHILELREGSSI